MQELKHHLKSIEQRNTDNEYKNLANAVIVQAISDYKEPEPRFKDGVSYRTFSVNYFKNHKRRPRVIGVRNEQSIDHRRALDARTKYNQWNESYSSAEYFLFQDKCIFYIWCECAGIDADYLRQTLIKERDKQC